MNSRIVEFSNPNSRKSTLKSIRRKQQSIQKTEFHTATNSLVDSPFFDFENNNAIFPGGGINSINNADRDSDDSFYSCDEEEEMERRKMEEEVIDEAQYKTASNQNNNEIFLNVQKFQNKLQKLNQEQEQNTLTDQSLDSIQDPVNGKNILQMDLIQKEQQMTDISSTQSHRIIDMAESGRDNVNKQNFQSEIVTSEKIQQKVQEKQQQQVQQQKAFKLLLQPNIDPDTLDTVYLKNHRHLLQTTEQKRLRLVENRLIESKRVAHNLVQKEKADEKIFTLNLTQIIHQEMIYNTNVAMKTIKLNFMIDIIMRVYFYAILLYMIIQIDLYLPAFVVLIVLPRCIYIGGIMSAFFFFNDHTASFRVISKIFNNLFDFQSVADSITIQDFFTKTQRKTRSYYTQRLIFAFIPPELCYLAIPKQNSDKKIISGYFLANYIFQGIESVVFIPVVALAMLESFFFFHQYEWGSNIFTFTVILAFLCIFKFLTFSFYYLIKGNQALKNNKRRREAFYRLPNSIL